MTPTGDWNEDMERFALDPDTADRLLSGALGSEDVPRRYGEVASLLQIAAGPTSGALDGEAAAVATVVEAIRSSPAPAPVPRRTGARTRLKAATAVVVAGLTLTGGLAAADALPAPAQQVASDALAAVGVHVPTPSGGPATGAHKPTGVDAGRTGTPASVTTPPDLGTATTVRARTQTSAVSTVRFRRR